MFVIFFSIASNVTSPLSLISANSIFYLMSRGLDKKTAKELLINGFLLDVVEKITDEEIKKLLKNMIGLN